jgi:hypothetical protein
MYRYTRLAAVLGCAATLAMVGCSSNSSGLTPTTGAAQSSGKVGIGFDSGWIHQDGVTYHTPHYMTTVQNASRQAKPDIVLNYGNGPVLVTPKMYYIFWGYKTYGDPQKVRKLLKSYAKNAGGSGYYNILTQYYMKSGTTNVYINNPSKILGGIYMDNTNAVPAHPTDGQVAAEALVAVSHFGYDANGSYIVATPTGHSSNGFATSWCAYHSATTSGGKLVSYTNLPYMPDAGGNCGAGFITPPNDESSGNEGVTIVEGHEYSESVTDPNPPSGWYNNQYGEIGDICAWTNVQNDPFGKKSYTSQPEFSNASQTCVHSYP